MIKIIRTLNLNRETTATLENAYAISYEKQVNTIWQASFSLPNFNNEKWIIDSEKYLVWRNGQETMIEIREFYLMPGDNEISITGTNFDIDLAIKFRDKYI